jgi:ribokinase
MKKASPKIVVVGSLNIDWTARVRHLPAVGQTVPASVISQSFGGKGANQAIAAARQGATVFMIGAIGGDEAGSAYFERLRKEGIDTTGISSVSKAVTGTALIGVDDDGENTIIVGAGANGLLKPSHVRQHADQIKAADVILLQWECPPACVLETLKIAARNRIPVVMNPSPLIDGFPWGRYPVHTLIINETEAITLFGKRVAGNPRNLRTALQSHGIRQLVITRGSEPTFGITADAVVQQSTLSVKPVDTVGAGDSFAGSFAAALGSGLSLQECLRHANIAGALATTKNGAQSSIPTLPAVKKRLKTLP